MARSLNRATLIGRLGRDPEKKQFSNGGSVVTFPLATSESWKDRNTGEQRERTEWHRIAIYSERLGRLAMAYLKKGEQVFIEGKMETRKWQDQDGKDRYTTEVSLRPFSGEMTFMGGSSKGSGETSGGYSGHGERNRGEHPAHSASGPRDDIPEDLYSGTQGYNSGPGGPYSRGRALDDDIPF